MGKHRGYKDFDEYSQEEQLSILHNSLAYGREKLREEELEFARIELRIDDWKKYIKEHQDKIKAISNKNPN